MSKSPHKSRIRTFWLAALTATVAVAGGLATATAFANESRPAPAAATPIKDGSFTAVLSPFDQTSRSVQAQPAVLKTGRKYCADHNLPATEAPCQRAWVVDPTQDPTLTVPLSRKLIVTDIRGGDPACIGSDGYGTCRVPASEWATLADITPLFRVVIKGGAAVSIAGIYTP